MPSMLDVGQQVATGVVPPQLGEAVIREVWPSVTIVPAAASLGGKLIRSIFLAPLGWLLLLPVYFLKVMPFIARRYTLTNRRLMIRRGIKPASTLEVALGDIDDARLVDSSIDTFFRSGTLEIMSNGKVALTLPAVPDPEAFRRAILDARIAWAPRKDG
jgi:Bacterial PH domain